jgi:hypothetical protein
VKINKTWHDYAIGSVNNSIVQPDLSAERVNSNGSYPVPLENNMTTEVDLILVVDRNDDAFIDNGATSHYALHLC